MHDSRARAPARGPTADAAAPQVEHRLRRHVNCPPQFVLVEDAKKARPPTALQGIRVVTPIPRGNKERRGMVPPFLPNSRRSRCSKPLSSQRDRAPKGAGRTQAPRTGERRRSGNRDDRRADLNAIVKVDDFLVQHADAAIGDRARRPICACSVGAVNGDL